MKFINDPNDLIHQVPAIKDAMNQIYEAVTKKWDEAYVWFDEDGEVWWMNIQSSEGSTDRKVDKGFKLFPYREERFVAIGKFFIAINEALNFINTTEPEKTYAVDVHWDVAKTYYIKAKSREEAIEKMEETIKAGEVCVWTDGFEPTDDVQTECHGEGPDEDHIQFD